MSQIQAMREKLEEFYRSQFREKFRVKNGKTRLFVQEFRDGSWDIMASFEATKMDYRFAGILAHTAIVQMINNAVAQEMGKLEEKAHGGGDGGSVTLTTAESKSEPAQDAGSDEPAGGVLFPASRSA